MSLLRPPPASEDRGLICAGLNVDAAQFFFFLVSARRMREVRLGYNIPHRRPEICIFYC